MGSSFSSSGSKPKPKPTYSSGGGGLFGTSSAQDFLDAFNAQSGPAAPAGAVSSGPVAPPYNPYASPLYSGALANAKRTYSNYLGNAWNQQNLAAADLGYTLDRDALVNDDQGNIIGGGTVKGGNIDWNTIDTSNPFSRAALLKRSYQQGQEGSKNSLAARGFLNSGAMNNALASGQFNYEQGQDSIAKQLAQIIQNSNAGTATAAGDFENTVSGGLLDAIRNAPTGA